MAHLFDHRQYTPRSHVHFFALMLLAAVVLVVTLTVPAHKPLQAPSYGNAPAAAPR